MGNQGKIVKKYLTRAVIFVLNSHDLTYDLAKTPVSRLVVVFSPRFFRRFGRLTSSQNIKAATYMCILRLLIIDLLRVYSVVLLLTMNLL